MTVRFRPILAGKQASRWTGFVGRRATLPAHHKISKARRTIPRQRATSPFSQMAILLRRHHPAEPRHRKPEPLRSCDPHARPMHNCRASATRAATVSKGGNVGGMDKRREGEGECRESATTTKGCRVPRGANATTKGGRGPRLRVAATMTGTRGPTTPHSRARV